MKLFVIINFLFAFTYAYVYPHLAKSKKELYSTYISKTEWNGFTVIRMYSYQ